MVLATLAEKGVRAGESFLLFFGGDRQTVVAGEDFQRGEVSLVYFGPDGKVYKVRQGADGEPREPRPDIVISEAAQTQT